MRAPHKPLLTLWALGQCLSGKDRMVSYKSAKPALSDLLEKFGPPRKTGPEYPFWYLQSDEIWELSNAETVHGKASNRKLIDGNVHGRFTEDVYSLIQNDPALAAINSGGTVV